MITKFLSYYKPHKKLFIIDTLCSLGVSVCSLFFPYIAQNIIDVYVPDRNLQLVLVWAVILLVIYMIKTVLYYVIQYWGHVAGTRVQADMRSDFFRHIQKLPFQYFDENKTGTIMSRIVNDLFDVSELAHHGLEDTLTSVVTICGAFIMMALTNIYLALISVAFLPLMLFFALRNRKAMRQAFRKSREKVGEINASVESSISGIRVTKAYTASGKEIEKFERSNAGFKQARAGAYKQMGIFHSTMSFFNDLIYLAVLVAGGLFFYFGIIKSGDYTAFILYVTMMLKPITTIVNIYQQLQDGATGFKRFCEILNISPEPDPDNAVPLLDAQGEIEFRDVSFSYKSGADETNVLKGLTMHIAKDSTVAIVGPSGGGKTTLCHLIPRFYDVEEGSITIDGIDIRNIKRDELRKNIAIVAQDVFLFNGTIKENIAYGDLNADDNAIIEAAQKANIYDFILDLPEGMDTNVGERGVKLSGGQKQRISIARAFLKNPPILILDEATSALDNMTEMQVQSALESLSAGRTTLVVAHRLSTIKNADEIIVLTKAGIEERGTHEELMEKGGIYKSLYMYQFK